MIRSDGLLKYPRTPHLEGSRLQDGDEDSFLPYSSLAGKFIVVEEKLDGANCGLSVSSSGNLMLQSRGHFLVDGPRERHFSVFKKWAARHEDALFDLLGARYIMFGEWMQAKHSMFYDALPHLFLEFDIFDKEAGQFLSTQRRHSLLAPLPIVSMPVLYSGLAPPKIENITSLVGLSVARSPQWRAELEAECKRQELDVGRVQTQTDQDDCGEGLYLKIEDADYVLSRAKLVRRSFTQTILDGAEHWQKRPMVPNGLRPGQDIFASQIDKNWPAFCPAPLKKSGHAL
jgi:hypothetical protein